MIEGWQTEEGESIQRKVEGWRGKVDVAGDSLTRSGALTFLRSPLGPIAGGADSGTANVNPGGQRPLSVEISTARSVFLNDEICLPNEKP